MKSTIDLVTTLYIYQSRFGDLIKEFPGSPEGLILSSSLSYKTLQFRLKHNDVIYIQSTYHCDDHNVTWVDSYFENKKIIDQAEPQLKKLAPVLESFTATNTLESIQLKPIAPYLQIAETIAREAYQCASGDDYSPGYFSKIQLTPDGVRLAQINHLNSRSLDHKTNYSLRNLEFFIPYYLQQNEKAKFEDECIGAMQIHFSDRSSANNKNCGDRIRKQIDEAREKFNQSA